LGYPFEWQQDYVLSGTDANTKSGHMVERLLLFYSVLADELVSLFSGRSESFTTEHIFFAINNSATMRATRSAINLRFLELAIPNSGTNSSDGFYWYTEFHISVTHSHLSLQDLWFGRFSPLDLSIFE
jgi:hypothetical protein